MKRIWDRIHVWLAFNAPAVNKALLLGATEEQIRTAEAEMGVKLPDDVKVCYRIHNGCASDLFYGWDWQGLAGMLHCWHSLKRQVDGGFFDRFRSKGGWRIRTDWWHPAWVPVSTDQNGNFYCIDLAPEPYGDLGQVILWWHDNVHRSIVAPSFTSWIEEFAAQLEEGLWGYDEEFGGLVDVADDLEGDE
jgi:cell wall assembly regulator SMI1